MILEPLAGPGGPVRVRLEPREDARGLFARTFCTQEFAEAGIAVAWVQINMATNVARGTLRGLHFQRPPMADAKLVRCVRGAILDVGVDLRAGSGSFGRAVALELSEGSRDMLYLPPGFAHGYQTLTPETELLYLHSRPYSPAHEGGLAWDDPALGIEWPLPVTGLSDRDAHHPRLADLDPIHP